MADTTINPPSSSLKLYYRVARFAWQSGEQYLGFTSDHYFRLPSSHIYETCENFICWETEWIALPAHRSAAETASISILSSGELCSGEVAANERSESATPVPLSSLLSSTCGMYYTNKEDMSESATGQTSPSEYTASLTEAELLAECEVAEVLARIEVALDEARSWEWMVTYWSNRLTVDCWRGTVMAIGVIDNYGTVINLPRRVFLQHFTYTH
jgi:hypothetical protein